jgi:hypothetical protein
LHATKLVCKYPSVNLFVEEGKQGVRLTLGRGAHHGRPLGKVSTLIFWNPWQIAPLAIANAVK